MSLVSDRLIIISPLFVDDTEPFGKSSYVMIFFLMYLCPDV